MKKVLIVLGPTATGKTDLALELARKFNGELVAADSRQVYKGLDIGTGKNPSKKVKVKRQKNFWLVDGQVIQMYDVASAKKQYNLFNYLRDALPIIENITKAGKLPIIVGGTGLYIKGLLLGLDNQGPEDPNLRKSLEELSIEELQRELKAHSPGRLEQLTESDQRNKRRLIRAIELSSMYPYTNKQRVSGLIDLGYQFLKIGLSAPRPVLNDRIDHRLETRIQQGMLDEGRSLLNQGVTFKRLKQLGLEYGLLAEVLTGRIDQQVFVNRLKNEIHQFAKRQMTWFKKDSEIIWFDITQTGFEQNLEREVSSWYYSGKSKS